MGEIDQELRDALQHAEAQRISTTDVQLPAVTPEPARSRGLLLFLLVAAAALLTAVAYLPMSALTYAVKPDELRPQQDSAPNKSFNLQGILVSGSMRYRQTPCEYRMRIVSDGKEFEIHYPSCLLPDTVQDRKGEPIEVTATGVLAADGHFQANNVKAKCASKEGYRPEGLPRPKLIEATRID